MGLTPPANPRPSSGRRLPVGDKIVGNHTGKISGIAIFVAQYVCYAIAGGQQQLSVRWFSSFQVAGLP